MKNNKQEIILSQEVASVDKFWNMIKKNIFPLCIYLNEKQRQEYIEKGKIGNVDLVNELYSTLCLEKYLFLSGHELREKIESGEVYVNRFLDDSKKVKNVRFIAPAFGYDLDTPKVVFRKTPRLFFRKMDHFSLDSKYNGEEIFSLCIQTVEADEKQKSFVKIKQQSKMS